MSGKALPFRRAQIYSCGSAALLEA